MRKECPLCDKRPGQTDDKGITLCGSTACLTCRIDTIPDAGDGGVFTGDEQKLLRLLERQYNEKVLQMTKLCNLGQKVKNPLFKLYFDKITFDTSRHASVLGSLIATVKGKRNVELKNAGLSLEDIDMLRVKGREGTETYLESLRWTGKEEVRLLLIDLLLDEGHNLWVVNELWSLLFDGVLRRRKGCAFLRQNLVR